MGLKDKMLLCCEIDWHIEFLKQIKIYLSFWLVLYVHGNGEKETQQSLICLHM